MSPPTRRRASNLILIAVFVTALLAALSILRACQDPTALAVSTAIITTAATAAHIVLFLYARNRESKPNENSQPAADTD